MAKSNKKKNGKGKSKTMVPTPTVSKRSYFESERLRNLPFDRCYFGHYKDQGDKFLMAVFTRRHVTGNISFGYFGISDDFGELFDVFYDYNLSQEDFDELFKDYELAPFDKIQALEQLVYDAALCVHCFGENLPEEFNIAKRILPDQLEGWEEISLEKLASFQVVQTEENTAELPDKWQDINDISDNELSDNEAVLYDPTTVQQWTAADWKSFQLELMANSNDKAAIFDDWFIPLAYTFEKVFLQEWPRYKDWDNALAILESSPANLTMVPDKLTYKSTSHEWLVENALWYGIEDTAGQNVPLRMVAILEEMIQKYPQNPRFKILLHTYYKNLNQQQKALEVSSTYHKLLPKNSKWLIYYFADIVLSGNDELISNFLAQGCLLEQHLAQKKQFYYRDYFFYYFTLGNSLAGATNIGTLWRLYKALTHIPEFKEYKVMQKVWQNLLYFPLHVSFELFLRNDPKEMEQAMAKILE
jgi:hypothetical protein